MEKGSAVLKRAEYGQYQANAFYANKAKEQGKPAPYLPEDAGSMLIAAWTGLNLDGLINAAPERQGRGGRLDIAADQIAVVAQARAGEAVAGAVRLVAE